MKIDRFNIPDYNFNNEVKNESPAQNNFSARLESANLQQTGATTSPLQNQLAGIARSTDFNNSISTRVAIDQATRSIVGGLISPDLKNRINVEAMMSAISDFAQNDPALSGKLQRLLLRLS